MGWMYLLLAIVFEICGTFSMKESSGLRVLWPSVLVFLFYGLCLLMMTFATSTLDLSIAYTVWAGLGTALVTLIGIIHYRESCSFTKLFCIGLIIAGVAGLSWIENKT